MTAFGGIFGIHNHAASDAAGLAVIVLVIIWLALVYWTFADARRRIEEPILIGFATLVSLVPFIGTIIYMIVRPPEYLADVRERSLEIQAAEARLAQIGTHTCPHCDYEVQQDFLRCPNCLRKLREPCVNCGKPLASDWKICPYCETDRGIDPALVRRQRRSRRDPQETMVAPPPSDLI
jgi:RNA polymerase subunit RPABC4/transcription elongation factor Spt4